MKKLTMVEQGALILQQARATLADKAIDYFKDKQPKTYQGGSIVVELGPHATIFKVRFNGVSNGSYLNAVALDCLYDVLIPNEKCIKRYLRKTYEKSQRWFCFELSGINTSLE